MGPHEPELVKELIDFPDEPPTDERLRLLLAKMNRAVMAIPLPTTVEAT